MAKGNRGGKRASGGAVAVGTSDLDIVATLIDGSQVEIFKNGDFAI